MSTKTKKNLLEVIKIPEQVNVNIVDGILSIYTNLGKNEFNFKDPRILIEKENDKILLKAIKNTRNEKKLLKTFKAHINNLINGVIKKYNYKLKICSGHFPMNVSVSNNKIIIKNFLAEKIPREAKILQDVEVEINGDVIIVTGVNKEKVGQTAANIEQACRITDKDRRIFMDGIYITSKNEE